ncbi:MAG: phosphoribosylformylglycinamidine synthase subunit PurS [Marinilabiliales bacterium]
MKFIVEIDVMPLKALLDPQGKAVKNTINNIGFKGVKDIRIGKHIRMELEAENEENARKNVDEICQKVLINPVMEGYEFTIKPA